MEIYRVYILTNPHGKRYIGVSENVLLRLDQHNSGLSKWTNGKGPWSLFWSSNAMHLTDARKLENALKRQKGGIGLQKLIQAHNPAHAGS
ncbi:MAG: GIY-YIG nuclease family protein [Chthoniobacterales bacterium]